MSRRFQPYSNYDESGVAWIGEMPSHWGLQRTKTFFNRMQRPVRTQDGIVTAFRDGEVTLRSNRRTDGFTNAAKEIGYQGVRVDDLVVHAMDGFAGAIGVSDSDGKCSPVYSVCTPKQKDKVHVAYYGYLVRQLAVTDFINSLAKGIRERSTEFRYSEFSILNLAVPPVEEQKQIAAFLDYETAKIDALIEKQQQLIALLGEKRQAVISHAVTKGLNPDAPMRDSGIEWLGEVPEHWDVKMIGQIANVVRGGSPRPAGDPLLFNGDYSPWVTVAEITKDGEIDLTETATFLTKRGSNESRLFKSGTLLMTNSGGSLGVPKILRIDANANDGVLGFLDLQLNPHFVYFYLTTLTEYLREIVKLTGGSTQINLNTNLVKKLAIAVPPDDEIEQIEALIFKSREQYKSLQEKAHQTSELLKERRIALISAAVTGKIDVRGWKPPSSGKIDEGEFAKPTTT